MTEGISDELRDHLLAELEPVKPMIAKMARAIKSDRARVEIPLYLDGVVDFLVFDVAKQRFTELRVAVGIGGGMRIDWGIEGRQTTAAHFDRDCIKFVSVPLPPDFLEGINA